MRFLAVSNLMITFCCLLTLSSTTTFSAQKKRWGCRKKRPLAVSAVKIPPEARRALKSLKLDELEKVRAYYSSCNDNDKELTVVERMVSLATDQHQVRTLKLTLADLYFKTGSLEKATKIYTNYLLLYPGSELAPYATHQAILCLFYTTLTTDRDQTRTRATIHLAQSYVQKCEAKVAGYAQYEGEVRRIMHECANKLLEYDINIINFHYKQGNFAAAQARLGAVKKELVALMQGLDETAEPRLILLEADLYQQLGNKELADAKMNEVANRFPLYQSTLQLAATQSPAAERKSARDRF